MERLTLTAEQVRRFEEWPRRQANRVWDFTLLIGETRIPLTPMAYDRAFNFDNLWQDVYIQALIDPTIFDSQVFPNRRTLKLEMTYDYRRSHTGSETQKLKPVTDVLEVLLTDTSVKALTNPSVAGTQVKRVGDQTLTLIDFKVVDSDIADYYERSIAGIPHKSTMDDVLKLFLRPGATPEPASRPPVLTPKEYWFNDYSGIVGCQITPPDNTNRYPQVIIPFDTSLKELPEFLQENYGIYNDGLASCIDRGIVYVFPLAKWSRFDEEVKTLTITNADPNAFSGLETTYLVDDLGKVEIVSTGEVQHVDNSDWVERKHGIGKVWIDADTYLDGGVERNPDDTIFAARSELMRDTADIERSDGRTRKRWSKNSITANGFAEETRERLKRTSVIIMEWTNSNHDVVFPGMPVMVRTQIGEKMVEIRGTLVGVNTAERKIKAGLADDNFASVSKLSILIPAVGL